MEKSDGRIAAIYLYINIGAGCCHGRTMLVLMRRERLSLILPKSSGVAGSTIKPPKLGGYHVSRAKTGGVRTGAADQPAESPQAVMARGSRH